MGDAMDQSMRWKIEGFQSGKPTGFWREVMGCEARIKLLLERLVARHVTDSEIADATMGSSEHFSINTEKHLGRPIQMATTGNPYYMAIEVRGADRS
jgi:hypothetical protein